ncbi:MAG: UDP-N-acetylmuramoyl-L-alanine--D-glutamate ligase [Bacteroidales bacterium]|jgi:UDP-N-acetylmuramoylalanine--D-glutamate ligase|nr:UDP-N-acetylmuramoyl-L-alanine--D-glutamate ligase [Bacteroidales bacterium]
MEENHYFYKVFHKKHTIILKPQDHYDKYIKLRQQYPYFRYVDYAFKIHNNELELKFTFDISDAFTFTPSLKLQHRDFYNLNGLSPESMSNMAFHIGMIELISYWKLTCSPTLIIEPHRLSDEQMNWWKKLYYHGLGEFFYLNGINPNKDDFVNIPSKGNVLQPLSNNLSGEKVIVPIGGGKDSIVTLKLLKGTDFQLIPMVLNPREASVRTIETAGFVMDTSIVVERTLDPLMLELNTRGFLNGHTPFSALLAFVNVLAAVASGAKYVALSNENSANQSTVPGSDINHQYSKSFEFERDFAFYSKKYVHPDLVYFSFLRPLNELQIGKLFSSFSEHFSGFRSCNVGSKEDKWCGKCPKCLFTFIILSPFVPGDQLYQIFGKDMLNDAELKPIFDELTGKSPVKPFECVGTPDEIKAALDRSYEVTSEEKPPELLRNFQYTGNGGDDFRELMSSFNTENLLPLSFMKVLLNKQELPLSIQFKLFILNKFGSNPEIVILGFGREGISSYKQFRSYYPEAVIHIADKDPSINDLEITKGDPKLVFHTGKGYQSRLRQFSIIVKSPGVKLHAEMPNEKCLYSQADLFLEFFRDQTIGITGTKGKSTTSSLIHHLLEKSGKDTVLLGNIGIPPFDMLDQINLHTAIVYEMSAHQLENVKHSPHIGVLLNIFPEHLDHFNSFDAYKKAKNHIFKFQKPGDVALVQDAFSATVNGRKIIFADKKISDTDAYIDQESLVFASSGKRFEIDDSQLALKGDHNKLNMLAAMLAVSAVGVELKTSFSHLGSFKPLPHRLEFVGRFDGIDFYNDSISTVPESTIAAINTLQDVKTLILGGYDRGIDYDGLVTFLNESEIENLLFLGKAGDTMMQLFFNSISSKNLVKVADIQMAVEYAFAKTISGKCLLSPAASSYDQFHNFEHRGDTFKQCVQQLGHKKSG